MLVVFLFVRCLFWFLPVASPSLLAFPLGEALCCERLVLTLQLQRGVRAPGGMESHGGRTASVWSWLSQQRLGPGREAALERVENPASPTAPVAWGLWQG